MANEYTIPGDMGIEEFFEANPEEAQQIIEGAQEEVVEKEGGEQAEPDDKSGDESGDEPDGEPGDEPDGGEGDAEYVELLTPEGKKLELSWQDILDGHEARERLKNQPPTPEPDYAKTIPILGEVASSALAQYTLSRRRQNPNVSDVQIAAEFYQHYGSQLQEPEPEFPDEQSREIYLLRKDQEKLNATLLYQQQQQAAREAGQHNENVFRSAFRKAGFSEYADAETLPQDMQADISKAATDILNRPAGEKIYFLTPKQADAIVNEVLKGKAPKQAPEQKKKPSLAALVKKSEGAPLRMPLQSQNTQKAERTKSQKPKISPREEAQRRWTAEWGTK